MVGDLRDLVERSEAASLDVTWSPAAGWYVARVWVEVDPGTPGTASNTWTHAGTSWLEQVSGPQPGHRPRCAAASRLQARALTPHVPLLLPEDCPARTHINAPSKS